MARKKKQPIMDKRPQRLKKAKIWLPTYEGTKIVKAYRQRYGVDTICAITELEMLGYRLEPDYVENLKQADAVRVEHLRRTKEEKAPVTHEPSDFQNDMFFFIAGYTSGGAPYGATWDEVDLEPYEDTLGDDIEGDAVCYRHYDFLSKREQATIDNRLREDFSQYVKAHRRLPSRHQQQKMIEAVFSTCAGGPIEYTKDFNVRYRKIVRKRENAFIREGVLSKRFTPSERKMLFTQSVTLESERLIFRKITADDFNELARMLRDPEVMCAWEHTFSDEEIQEWINSQILRYRDDIVGYFAAISKETGALVGQMGLMWSDIGEVRALELGYMLNREYWGNGYATEGAEALTRYAFDQIGVNKVYATIRPENARSARVAQRVGMTAEGTFIKHCNGTDMEHVIYSKCRCATTSE